MFAAAPWYDRGHRSDSTHVTIDYKPTIDRGGRGDRTARYMWAAHEAFTEATGVGVRVGPPVPELYLDRDQTRPYLEPYYVVASGVKQDMTVKAWPTASFQAVISASPERNWKQVGEVYDGRLHHYQSALDGAENLIGGTSLRSLITLIAHAEGVLCHLSLPMLIAAAFRVPCVVVAGGRESPWLFDDMGPAVLHTIGRLKCCETRGCYSAAALPGRTADEFPKGWLCSDPVPQPNSPRGVGRCMTLITPETVLAALSK